MVDVLLANLHDGQKVKSGCALCARAFRLQSIPYRVKLLCHVQLF